MFGHDRVTDLLEALVPFGTRCVTDCTGHANGQAQHARGVIVHGKGLGIVRGNDQTQISRRMPERLTARKTV